MNARTSRRLRLPLLATIAFAASAGSAAPAAAAFTFTPWPGSPFETPFAGTPTGPALLERVDLDTDPRPDLVSLSGQTVSLTPRPSSGFAAGPTVLLSGSPGTLAAAGSGDIDGNGRRDLITWVDNGGDLNRRIWSGTTSGLSGGDPNTDSGLSDIAVGDVNGDGRDDQLKVSGSTRLSAGTASGDLSNQAGDGAVYIGQSADNGAVGDLTGDGKAEVVLAGTDTNGAFVQVRPAPALTSVSVTIRPGVGPGRMLVADGNGDGRADVIGVRSGSVQLYAGDGAGGLAAPVSTTLSGVTPNAAAADFDDDGITDVAVTTTAQDRVFVLAGRRTGGFGAPAAVTTANGAQPRGALGDLVAADFDADGDPDLAFASRSGYRVDVLRNDRPAPTPAATPTPLPPTARTADPTPIGFESATVGGSADLKGQSGSVWFQYGRTATYGTETPKEEVAPGARGERAYGAALTGLEPDREYHVRITVTTPAGTNVGQDVTFRTAAPPAPDHAATIVDLPDRVVAGVPTTLRATGAGSFPPYTYAWKVDDVGTAEGQQVDFRFPAVPLSPADAAAVGTQGAGDGNARRGSRKVTVIATDRFGRTAEAFAYVTVLPNRAPVAGVRAVDGQLEYAQPNALRDESVDPDSGASLQYDRVAKTSWAFDGRPAFTTLAGAESRPTVMPWRLDRAGKPALGDVLTPGLDIPGFPGRQLFPGGADKTRLLAEAIKQYPEVVCGAATLSMFGCWPHRTAITASVRAEDRAGAAGEASVTLPIRLRARPAVDVTLRNPAAKTDTGDTRGGSQELPAGITPETVLNFDPGNTVIDGREDPAYYVLEIGKPWQLSCVSGKPKPPTGGIVQPVLDAPLREVARTIVLDNPFEGPSLSAPGLVGGEAVGTRAQLKEGDQVSLGKGCINGVFGVNSPIKTIVATNKAQLLTAIPQEGRWSAMLSVFDRIGARGNVRLDGIAVGPVAKTCADARQTFSGKGGFSWTGTCVSSMEAEQTFWTQNPIDMNGVRLAPAAGKYLVIEGGPSPRVSTAAIPPAIVPGTEADPRYDLKGWKRGDGGKVGVVIDDQVIAKIPASRTPPVRIKGDSSGGRLVLDGTVHRGFEADSDASYGGLPFVGDLDVDLTSKKGCATGDGSLLTAQLQLPQVFKSAATPQAQTTKLELAGCNRKSKSVINKRFDGSAARAGLGRTPSGSAKARRAIVDAPPATIDLSGLSMDPVRFNSLVLQYEPASGAFRGNGKAELMGQKFEITVAITDGALTEAGGKVPFGGPTGVNIPGTPVNLKSLAFNVETVPALRFVGVAELSDPTGNIVSVNGTIGFQPEPLAITLDGEGAVGPGGLLSLARVHLEVSDGELSISGYSGRSIGPFSYEISAGGSFSQYGFNIEGAGRACVFACLGVRGVLSDRGAALCGEIDLWLATLRPGLGVLWKGPDIDGYLDGCSVAPYRGNLKPQGAGAQRLAGPWKATVDPGQTLLTAVASSGVAGRPPKVTLRGPGTTVGTPADVDGQTVDAAKGTLVDVDRLSGQVRFVVSAPTAGVWEVTSDASDPAPATVEFGRSAPLPTAKAFKAKIKPGPDDLGKKVFATVLTSTAKGPAFVANPKVSKVIKLKPGKTKPGKVKPIKTKPGKLKPGRLVRSRVATTTVAVPYGKESFTKDLGPDLRKLVRSIAFDVDGLLEGDVVTLAERSDAPAVKAGALGQRSALIATPSDRTAQSIATFTVPPSGELADEIAFLPGVNGVRGRHIDAYVAGASGIPRGVVKDIASFGASKVAPSKMPPIKSVRAVGKRLKLTFGAGPSVGLKSKATQLTAVITGKDGGVRVAKIKGSDFEKAGAGFTVTVLPAGEPKGASIKLIPVGLAGKLAGAGKIKKIKVK